MVKRKWWKNPNLLGSLLYILFKNICRTLRVHVQKHNTIDPNQPYIFAFWHGKQLFPSLVLHQHHFTAKCVLVSPSHDGSILVSYLRKFGYDVIRGSSRDNNIAALITLRKKMLAGASIGTAIDGPIGPIYKVKPGLVFLAQKYNMPIIPMGSALSKAWIFNKAWDKFQIPKPFSKAALVLGQPYRVPKDMNIDLACSELAQIIHSVDQEALALI